MISASGGTVVCSSCGFDNQSGMRFCGMCGIPLPQRPITAPGAQSTLNFTRVPVDPRAIRETGTTYHDLASTSAETPAEPAKPSAASTTSDREATAANSNLPSSTTSSAEDVQTKELVPNVPLDEYVSKFRYDPPNDPAEITMRGDAHVAAAELEPSPQPSAPVSAAVDDAVSSRNAVESHPSPETASVVTPAEDVDQRLGIEPESSTEGRIARPRFLDINQPTPETRADPAKEILPANSGTSTIAGPSFLGLNEGPQSWADAIGVEQGDYAPRNYHLRLWFALAILLVFAVLGYKEWRAQVNQNESGPVEVVRTKLNGWKEAALARMGPPAVNTDSSTSKPAIQVVPQAQPQPPQQQNTPPADATANPAPGAPAQPSQNAEPAPRKSESTPSNTPAQNDTAEAPAPEQPKEAAAANHTQPAPAQPTAQPKPALKRQPDTSAAREAANAAPGADEMSRAKNASDSAAAAAWLWKATAKGNPDAPVQLANMYINGEGVPRSCEQAMVLLKTAAAKENALARNRLGFMYSTGTCVPRNRVEAYRWLSSALAANPKSEWAQQNRDLLWQQMNPEERAMAQRYR